MESNLTRTRIVKLVNESEKKVLSHSYLNKTKFCKSENLQCSSCYFPLSYTHAVYLCFSAIDSMDICDVWAT